MLHSLEHVRDHQNPLAGTPTLVSCQAPQLGRPRFAAEKVCRHPPSPKHSTLAYQLYHIWGSPEAGISGPRDISYAEIAACLARRLNADPTLVRSVSAASAGMPEGSTPRYTTLDSSALRARFGIAAPGPWPTIEELVAVPAGDRQTGSSRPKWPRSID